MSEFRLIIGLGNPGKDYEQTRHNFGFIVVKRIAKKFRLKFKRSLIFRGFVAQGKIDGQNVFLLLPLTYMNNSGIAVKAFIRRKKIALENILAVHDDLDLDFGRLRLKSKGGDAGHKGLKSLISHLKSEDFARLKLGIGTPRRNNETTDYVLSEFNSQEKKRLDLIIEEALDCCKLLLSDGLAKAMSQFNKK